MLNLPDARRDWGTGSSIVGSMNSRRTTPRAGGVDDSGGPLALPQVGRVAQLDLGLGAAEGEEREEQEAVQHSSNPTGVILHEEHLTELLGWASSHGVHVIVDEIYHGLTFGIEPPTALAIDDGVVVFNSFSKYFSMTGWRLGWIVAPPALVPRLERLAQNLTISAPTLSQRAGVAAFDATEECDNNVARDQRNRDSMLESLQSAGFHNIAPAEGAFYIWVEITHTGLTASELCSRWLAELDIAATPGIDFDPVRGERFVRLSIAGSEADIDEAGHRLVGWARNAGLVDTGPEGSG